MSWKRGHQSPQSSYSRPYNFFTSSLKAVPGGVSTLASSNQVLLPADDLGAASSYYGTAGSYSGSSVGYARRYDTETWDGYEPGGPLISHEMNRMHVPGIYYHHFNFAVLDLTTREILPFKTNAPRTALHIIRSGNLLRGSLSPHQQRERFLQDIRYRLFQVTERYRQLQGGNERNTTHSLPRIHRDIQITLLILKHYLNLEDWFPAFRRGGIFEDHSFISLQRRLSRLQLYIETEMNRNTQGAQAHVPVPPELKAAIKEIEWAEIKYLSLDRGKRPQWEQAAIRGWAGRRVRRVKSCFEGQLRDVTERIFEEKEDPESGVA